MPASFTDILSKPSIFVDASMLSPHFVPAILPFREKQIEEIMSLLAPSLKNQKPRNLFIYGKTGTGKTSSIKHVMEKFYEQRPGFPAQYLNCRIYNSRYRVLQKMLKSYVPELERSGFGLPFLYEKLIELISKDSGSQYIIVLDEIDMVKDLDDLIYTLTRVNDEIKKGGITIVGISNKLSFKDALDPRSKSSLYEAEMVFPPYTNEQLKEILAQRAAASFLAGAVESSAINLAAAFTAQESGDARYALQLLSKAGELAEQAGKKKVTDEDVELARKKVELDIAAETIATLPENHQLVLFAIASITVNGSRYGRLEGMVEGFLFSGELYEEYELVCKKTKKRSRSVRWYHEYLNDLEMLGLIAKTPSSKGVRGHTTLIKLGHDPTIILDLIGKNIGL